MKPPLHNFNMAMHPQGDMTQPFGTNASLYARFGLNGHNGHDYVRPHGTPMYAIEDGTVVNEQDEQGGFGKCIRIMSRERDANGWHREWTYAHNSKHYVKVNQNVKAGDYICDMGNTGFVVSSSNANGFWSVNPYAGTHLHLGLRYIKRDSGGWSYPGSNIKITVKDYQNGFRGAVDPTKILKAIKGDVGEDPRIPLMKQVIFLLEQKLRLLTK